MSATILTEEPEYDPFNPAPDPEADKETLISSLGMAQRFALFFVVCNAASKRSQLMDAVEARLPGKRVQRVAVPEKVGNLVDVLHEQVTTCVPDIVFVHGLENWLSSQDNPRSTPFLVNLNAARDYFPSIINCPMVLWIPQYVLTAIASAAPDFISVRSGVYTFPISAEERAQLVTFVSSLDRTQLLAINSWERKARLHDMESLLSEVRGLPETSNKKLDLAHLSAVTARNHHVLGDYLSAETLYHEALTIMRILMPQNDGVLVQVISSLGLLYKDKKQYAKAEPLLEEAAANTRKSDVADRVPSALNNLAELYKVQGKNQQAESLYLEALSLKRKSLHYSFESDYVISNNLAQLYMNQGNSVDAEKLFLFSLEVRRASLPDKHPDVAVVLNNIAALYVSQGRYAEAKPFVIEANDIVQNHLEPEHPRYGAIVSSIKHLLSKTFLADFKLESTPISSRRQNAVTKPEVKRKSWLPMPVRSRKKKK